MRHRTSRALPAALALSTALLASCGAGREPTRALAQSDADSVMVIDDPRITESSGLARSALHDGIFYTHNDNNSEPEVYAVGEDGAVRAVIDLEGAPNLDWEDISVTSGGRIWVADIGGVDEQGRTEVSLVSFPEPAELVDGKADWVSYRLAYEDGPHNAEAFLIDPDGLRKYVVTKDAPTGGIYAAPERLSQDGINTLARVGDAPANITSGSFSPDGRRIALRNYVRAFLYDGLDDSDPRTVELPHSQQGESLVLLEDGDLLVGSEGAGSEVVRVPVPDDPPA